MTRLPDWRARLSAYIDSVRLKPFAYGEHDCALFAAGAIEAITGVDPADGFRGRYSTLTGGLRALKKHGFETHFDMAMAVLTPVRKQLARVGDIAVVDVQNGLALGVVIGAQVAVLTETGMALVDLSHKSVSKLAMRI